MKPLATNLRFSSEITRQYDRYIDADVKSRELKSNDLLAIIIENRRCA